MIEAVRADHKSAGLTYGMVGGGQGSFIGDVHRKAIAFDKSANLVAGCFSRDPESSRATGLALGVDPSRLYADAAAMAAGENRRADKIDFAVIVTPNSEHYRAAMAFLQAGIHVVCEKPLTFTAAEAEELDALARSKGLLFCVTYTYSGYPAVKQAKALIASGALGELRFVNAEYPQEWLAGPLEATGQKQAAWRSDPKFAGISNCTGDIGSHIEHLVAYVTGLRIQRLCARLDTFVPGRTLDDNSSVMVDFAGGAKGLYWSSQIAIGHGNGLKLRVYGTKASLEWSQEQPNSLRFCPVDRPAETWSRGRDTFSPHAQAYSRIPSGHPEGYYEAFANLYATFCRALGAIRGGRRPQPEDLDFPTAREGANGVRYIGKCVESSRSGSVWVNLA